MEFDYMANATKRIVLTGAIALLAVLFLQTRSEERSITHALSEGLATETELSTQAIGDSVESSNAVDAAKPRYRSLVLENVQTRDSRESVADTQLNDQAPDNFSPVLSQIVTREQLQEDIETWEQDMQDKGLVSYTENGTRVFPLYDPDGAANNSSSLHNYFDRTL